MTCAPCDLGHHWVCNRARLTSCDCTDPAHDVEPPAPLRPFGERDA